MEGKVTVEEARAALANGQALLIDVRETPEHRYERIEGVRNIPQSALDAEIAQLPQDRSIFVLCQSGMRSADAAAKLRAAGLERSFNVEGGLEAWKRASYPVVRGKGVLPIMRQVQIIAGSLVLIGALVPGMLWLSALIGAGLLFAGLSGTCMMAEVLSRLPFNRTKPTC